MQVTIWSQLLSYMHWFLADSILAWNSVLSKQNLLFYAEINKIQANIPDFLELEH
jgi:hypothetical protein